jgi:hypothetical protein
VYRANIDLKNGTLGAVEFKDWYRIGLRGKNNNDSEVVMIRVMMMMVIVITTIMREE